MSGILYLVATPIGNLGDISTRAAQTLSDADFIAAEDTRVTRKLLTHLDIKKQLISYHEHNLQESGARIVNRLISGEVCALVTDAGTPAISDPGEALVRSCLDAGISVISIPGPCAAVAALSISGLSAGRFTFEGFLSTASKRRFEHLNELKHEKRVMVFYEAPHKLLRTLRDLLESFGDRRISISRELTKIFEETFSCFLSEAVTRFEQSPPRGEFVIVVEGFQEIPATEEDFSYAVEAAMNYIHDGMSAKDAVKKAAFDAGIPKNKLYSEVVNLQKEQGNKPRS